jgi:hypothetical protein
MTRKRTDDQATNTDDRICEQLTVSCLWTLLALAERSCDVATLREMGWFALQEMADCRDRGLPHPFFRGWQRRIAENANRTAPSLSDQRVRPLIVLTVEALHRTGLKKQKARKTFVEYFRPTFREHTPTDKAIEHYQDRYEITPNDEWIINDAIERARGNQRQILRHFDGLIRFVDDPTEPAKPVE